MNEIALTCKVCTKTFYRKPGQVADAERRGYKLRYCSQECRKADYKNTHNTFTCQRCGKEFTRTDGQVRQRMIRGAEPTFCSNKCKGLYFGELSTRRRLGDDEYDRRTRQGLHEIYSIFGNLVHGANQRGFDVEITPEYLRELWDRQGGLCALSGLPMILANVNERKRRKTTEERNDTRYLMASVDRIDSNQGYVPGNIQWVCSAINLAKNVLPQEDFVNLCIAVAQTQEVENGKYNHNWRGTSGKNI